MRRAVGRPEKVSIGDSVDKSSLGDVTVRKTGEGHRKLCVYDNTLDETEKL